MISAEHVNSSVLEFESGGRVFKVLGFTAPKDGYSTDENEDAFAFAVDGDQLCVAIADGATESFFSRHWSRLLVDTFVSVQHPIERSKANTSWAKAAAIAFEGSHPLESLPWHAQAKGAFGSHATFAGLAISPTTLGYRCCQIGDCITLVKEGRIRQFPKSFGNSLKFGSQPKTLGTKNLSGIPYGFRSGRKSLKLSGGSFYLMSDALAESLQLGSVEANEKACTLLDEITDDASFSSLIGWLRSERRIKNDDVTFVRVGIVSR